MGTDTADGRRNLVRLLIADTEDTAEHPAIFANEEVAAFLSLNGDSVFYAGAQACEVWATTHSRLAKRMERDGTIHERWSPKELLACAERLREQAVSGSATGTIQTGRIVGSDQGYREERAPEWVSVNQNPPIL